MTDLDDTDLAILRLLVLDGSLGAVQVGERIGISQPSAWRRLRRLEDIGAIRGRSVELDMEAVGFGVTVFSGCEACLPGTHFAR